VTESEPSEITAAPVRIVAIDGPAGSGKSTVARLVASAVELPYLDTGAMYRSVAFASIGSGIDADDEDAIGDLARSIELEMPVDGRVIVNGNDATDAIRSPEVTRLVTIVAANPVVRTEMRDRQRRYAHEAGGGVLEGRDIGTVVFPDAMLKVYLTASIAERARRRAAQSGEDPAEVEAAMLARDDADSSREHAPMTMASDAVEVDTTDLSIDQVVTRIAELLAERAAAQ